MRVCAEAGCPELTESTRCPAHTRDRDLRRGTRQERGYDAAYDRRRKREARTVATGSVTCWRCGKRIGVLDVWNLGHCDDDRTVIHGPEHEPCNLGARGACTHISHVR